MAKRVVDESSLTAVADAIRERAGTTEAMEFPDGFKSAVEGIPDYLHMKITNQVVQEYRNELVTALHQNAFNGFSGLKGVHFPNLVTIGAYGFQGAGCKKLDFPKLVSIGASAFQWSSLETLILRSNTVCVLENSNAFPNCQIGKGSGYIYVPRALVDGYKAATNWSTYASQIRAIEDYPEITGGAT